MQLCASVLIDSSILHSLGHEPQCQSGMQEDKSQGDFLSADCEWRLICLNLGRIFYSFMTNQCDFCDFLLRAGCHSVTKNISF
jgi:hypothetical protein